MDFLRVRVAKFINFTLGQIAMVTKKKEEEIKAIIEERTVSGVDE